LEKKNIKLFFPFTLFAKSLYELYYYVDCEDCTMSNAVLTSFRFGFVINSWCDLDLDPRQRKP